MMKKLIIPFSLVCMGFYRNMQNITINSAIPHYKILRADSTYVTWAALKKNRPVMVIYFMPDCPHCQHLMAELRENIAVFTSIQIVMITDTRTEYPYMNLLRNFSKTYNLTKYKNITMGTEYPTYNVNEYYRLQTTPFIAIYNHAGNVVKYFDKPAKIGDIAMAVKAIK